MPAPLRAVIPALVRRSVPGGSRGQGMGRFIYSEMLSRADKDLSAFEAVIGDGPFLFGESIVASVASIVAAIAASPAATDLRERVRRSRTLTGHIGRVDKVE